MSTKRSRTLTECSYTNGQNLENQEIRLTVKGTSHQAVEILKRQRKDNNEVKYECRFQSFMNTSWSESTDSVSSELMEDTVEDIFAKLNNFEKESHKLLTDFTYKQDSIESLILVSEKIVICFKDKLLNAWTVKILYKEQFGHEKICFTVDWDNYPSNENIEDLLLLDPFEKKSFPLHHRPMLLSIVHSEDISTSETTCSLQKHLFISLFGSSTFLASQDVILLGLPDGRVVWKNICSVSNEAKAHLLCKLNQPIIGLFCTKLHLQKGSALFRRLVSTKKGKQEFTEIQKGRLQEDLEENITNVEKQRVTFLKLTKVCYCFSLPR
ncbi:uncharacterized protein LOC111640104 [Centruroides sculpturatus]|uniref:uncharacterized protein LOC111640104 n=1 Tax=Centruroides sculpturatus TaxID=218467 RepID=UPI000C6DF6E3|nr:uncharacterized protein LOC111640104 [Centruroides sculpturatus]